MFRVMIPSVILICVLQVWATPASAEKLKIVQIDLAPLDRPAEDLIIDGKLLSCDRDDSYLRVLIPDFQNAVFEVNLTNLPKRRLRGIWGICRRSREAPAIRFSNVDVWRLKFVSDSLKAPTPGCDEKKVDYADFTKIAAAAHDVDSFLKGLPKDVLLRFTLAHRSGSPQGASAKCPRIIRFSNDAKLIFAYRLCESPEEPSIEVIRYEERAFKFSRISFPAGRARVEENPPICAACHRDHLKRTALAPIWNEYPRWPGLFGSYDDQLLGEERAAYFALREARMGNPKLETLPFDPDDAFYPYSSGKFRTTLNPHFRPNLILSLALSNLRARSIAHGILATIPGERFRHAIASELLACPKDRISRRNALKRAYSGLVFEPDSGLPTSRNFEARAKVVLLAKASGMTDGDLGLSSNRTSPGYNDGRGDRDMVDSVKAALLSEVLVGDFPKLVPTSAFRDKGYGDSWNACLSEGIRPLELDPTQEERVCSALSVAQKLSDLSYGDSSGILACVAPEETKKVAKNAWTFTRLERAPLITRHCESCHDGATAREIPFANPEKLRALLTSPSERQPSRSLASEIENTLNRGAMPPDRNLLPHEKKALLEYVRSVMRGEW